MSINVSTDNVYSSYHWGLKRLTSWHILKSAGHGGSDRQKFSLQV
jgi:hypothetical protein